jgi:hypothetical protein
MSPLGRSACALYESSATRGLGWISSVKSACARSSRVRITRYPPNGHLGSVRAEWSPAADTIGVPDLGASALDGHPRYPRTNLEFERELIESISPA